MRKTEVEKTFYGPQSQKTANILSASIRNGEYCGGDKIPSVRALAKRLGVGRQVVLSAIAILSRAGLIYTDTKQGSFVNPNLKRGLYYRIGFFDNLENPMIRGRTLDKVYRVARHEGFQVISGSNYDETWGLPEWLDRKPNIDGLLITGIVDDALLETLKGRCLPYYVLGNYDISSKHPQSPPAKHKKIIGLLAEAFRKSGGKRIAAITGAECFLSHRESLDEIRNGILAAGLELDESLLYYCGDDGNSIVRELMEEKHPDVLFFRLDHWVGYLKYLERNPEAQKPYVIAHGLPSDEAPYRFYDAMIPPCQTDEGLAKKAVMKLIETIRVRALALSDAE